jgi:hypothetical protein
MFTLMQDPAVASLQAHLHVQERLEAAALHRLVRSTRTTREQPSPEPSPRRRHRPWAPLTLRLSFR